MVQSRWNINVAGSRMFQFQRKLKNVRTSLIEWRKKENTNSKKQIENIKIQIDRMYGESGKKDWDSWEKLRCCLVNRF